METRKCRVCDEYLPSTDEYFYRCEGKLRYMCKKCSGAKSAQWQRDNPEKARKIAERYRKNNPEKIAAKKKRWREDNPEKIKASRKKWCEKNTDKIRGYSRKWHENNREKYNKYMREYNKKRADAKRDKNKELSVEDIKKRKPHKKGRRGRPVGFRMSQETKDKIANSREGSKHSEDTKEKIASTLRGHRQSDVSKIDGKKRGSTFIDKRGYANTYVGEGHYVREYRLVAEKKIGRPLLSNEVVHHWNGDKSDNRPNNLFICTNRHHLHIHWIYNKLDIIGIDWETKEKIYG